MPSRSPSISTFLILAFGLVGCAFETPDEPLLIEAVLPSDGERWPANRPLRIIFDRYLDPASVDISKFELSSGEANASIGLAYDPVDTSVLVQPRLAMRVGVGYTLQIQAGAVRGLDGTEYSEDREVSFMVDAPLDRDLTRGPVDFEIDLTPVINARCGCHGPEPDAYPELTPNALIDQPAQRQENRVLVRSGEPLNSYLIQRILKAYPRVRGMEKTLSDEERRLFVRWVTELSGTGP